MQYLYQAEASASTLTLKGDEHRYIFKVRRHRQGECIYLRNLKDNILYRYEITHIDKRSLSLLLKDSQILEVKASDNLHIAWCVIDPKSIEKVLPTLNEMGVDKISFIYCKRSQKSFKLDFERLHKILLNSSQQSGRSEMMVLESIENLEDFLTQNPEAKMLNFSQEYLTKNQDIKTIVIGCEGGFSPEEVALFDSKDLRGLRTPLVLKSESAVCAVASILLL